MACLDLQHRPIDTVPGCPGDIAPGELKSRPLEKKKEKRKRNIKLRLSVAGTLSSNCPNLKTVLLR